MDEEKQEEKEPGFFEFVESMKEEAEKRRKTESFVEEHVDPIGEKLREYAETHEKFGILIVDVGEAFNTQLVFPKWMQTNDGEIDSIEKVLELTNMRKALSKQTHKIDEFIRHGLENLQEAKEETQQELPLDDSHAKH